MGDLRREYTPEKGLLIGELPQDPLELFFNWFDAACGEEKLEANAMVLATSDREGRPSARTVLLKKVEEGELIFFTQYTSLKGRHLQENPQAWCTFLWHPFHRQIHVRGRVERLLEPHSDAYFHSRPRGAQVGAWASSQSETIESYSLLMERFEKYTQKFEGRQVPRPPHWGGYRLSPDRWEFWQGRPSRLHDRVEYTWEGKGEWQKCRLMP